MLLKKPGFSGVLSAAATRVAAARVAVPERRPSTAAVFIARSLRAGASAVIGLAAGKGTDKGNAAGRILRSREPSSTNLADSGEDGGGSTNKAWYDHCESDF